MAAWSTSSLPSGLCSDITQSVRSSLLTAYIIIKSPRLPLPSSLPCFIFFFPELIITYLCRHIVDAYEYCRMNEWMNEWGLGCRNSCESSLCPLGFFLLGWRDIYWPPVLGASHRRGLLCPLSLLAAGKEDKALPKPLRSRSGWWARLGGKGWGCCGHGRHLESWKWDRAASQGRPKA